MRVLGHRGARTRVLENTVAAVRWALDHGADGVEVDVRRTADGLLVCCHDPSFAPYGGPVEPIVRLSATDLASVTLAGGLHVASVSEVLDAAAGRGRVVLEIKNIPGEPDFDAPDEATAALLVQLLADRRATGRVDDVVVSSFDWFAIDAVRDGLGGAVPTAFLAPPGLDLGAAVAFASDNGHAECHPHVSSVLADPTAVARAHDAGVGVVCWTVDDPAALRTLAAAGVDGVISDDPAAARDALTA